MDLFQLLYAFSGRINRAKYWIAVAIYFAVMVVAALLAFVLGFGVFFYVLLAILYIAMVISGIAVGIKRLHDRDKSGWWLLLFYLAPSVLSGIGMISGGWHIMFDLASFAISIWALVEFGILRGTIGPNQYGPDPLPN